MPESSSRCERFAGVQIYEYFRKLQNFGATLRFFAKIITFTTRECRFSKMCLVEDIALTMTPGIGVKGAVYLLELFGDARRIFAASADELTGRARLAPELARNICRRSGFAAAERELAYCARHGIRAIASTDPAYPPLLRETPDYPHVLYVTGDADALRARCVSVVGTRSATANYGIPTCNRLVVGLAERVPELCVVSGLAFGIDVAAHRAALAAGARSVAVLANPLPGVTPVEHLGVARDMAEHGGALVTELHSQVKQNGRFYLARNRIIAALSEGTVVVESKFAGGALVTASLADGYDRTVMAVPGRVGDAASAGTNHLIRTQKARMVRSAGDIIEELGWDRVPGATTGRPMREAPAFTADEERLLACMPQTDPIALETLRERCGADAGTLATLLIGLELAGAVRQLPGNRYVKLR